MKILGNIHGVLYSEVMAKIDNNTKLYALSLFCLVCISFLGLVTSKFYSSDGAMFLLTLLLKEELFHFQDGRIFIHYLYKVPALLAMKLGVTNFEVISTLLGFPFYLQMIFSIVVSRWFLEGTEYKNLFVIPIIAVFVFMLNTELAIESESLALASIFWPVFFYLFTKQSSLKSLKAVVFLVCALVLPYSYETFVVCALPLIYLLYQKRTQSKIFKVLLIYYCVSALSQIYFIIYHRQPHNIDSFFYSTFNGLAGIGQNYSAIGIPLNLSLVFILFVLVFYIYSVLGGKKWKGQWTIISLSFVGVGVLLLVISYPSLISRQIHLNSRILTAFSPLLLSMLIVALIRSKLYQKLDQHIPVLMVIILFQTAFSFTSTWHWREFTNRLINQAEGETGVYQYRHVEVYEHNRLPVYMNYMPWSLVLYSTFLDRDKIIESYPMNLNHKFANMVLKQLLNTRKLDKYGFKLDNNE